MNCALTHNLRVCLENFVLLFCEIEKLVASVLN